MATAAQSAALAANRGDWLKRASRLSARCDRDGVLEFREHCYALRCGDGARFWLEMDVVPPHLIDRPVHVEGAYCGGHVIAVARIGPLAD